MVLVFWKLQWVCRTLHLLISSAREALSSVRREREVWEARSKVSQRSWLLSPAVPAARCVTSGGRLLLSVSQLTH